MHVLLEPMDISFHKKGVNCERNMIYTQVRVTRRKPDRISSEANLVAQCGNIFVSDGRLVTGGLNTMNLH